MVRGAAAAAAGPRQRSANRGCSPRPRTLRFPEPPSETSTSSPKTLAASIPGSWSGRQCSRMSNFSCVYLRLLTVYLRLSRTPVYTVYPGHFAVNARLWEPCPGPQCSCSGVHEEKYDSPGGFGWIPQDFRWIRNPGNPPWKSP